MSACQTQNNKLTIYNNFKIKILAITNSKIKCEGLKRIIFKIKRLKRKI